MRSLACLLLLFTATAFGVDLSGTWKMDPARSESAHQAVPIGPVLVVIQQTPSEIVIETRRTEAGKGEVHSERLPFKLNGAEMTTTVGDVAVKTKAHWDGAKLVTETERIVNESTITTRQVHSLNPTLKELKVEKTLTVQHGYQGQGEKSYGTGTDVFVKAAAVK